VVRRALGRGKERREGRVTKGTFPRLQQGARRGKGEERERERERERGRERGVKEE